MASRRTSQVTVPRTTRTAAGRRRAAAAAAGALIAAALVGPAPANAGWSSTSPSGGNDPAGYGGAPDATDNGGGGGVPEQSLPSVTARAAIVVDRATGNVLGATNPDLLWAPASTTKMMTGLLASEAIAAGEASLSDTVRIPGNVAIEGGGSIGLAPGDTISLQDLLYIAMLDSKGVAGYGECTGGNQFWEEDCAHYSTARDLAALARVLLDDPLLATIVSTPSRRTTTWRSHTGASRDYTVTSTNDLLPTRPQAYPGAYGVKTGTTHMAGEVLVSAAKNDPQGSASGSTRQRGHHERRPAGILDDPEQPAVRLRPAEPGTPELRLGCDRGGPRLRRGSPVHRQPSPARLRAAPRAVVAYFGPAATGGAEPPGRGCAAPARS